MPFDSPLPLREDRVLSILIRAQELIRDERCWIKGSLARDAYGRRVRWRHLYRGQKFCAAGAIYSAAGQTPWHIGGIAKEACRCFRRANGFTSIAANNDDKTTRHWHVVHWFDKAINTRKLELMMET